MRLKRYKPVAEYITGKNMIVADMFSRNPMNAEDGTQHSADVDLRVNAVTSSWPVSEEKLDQIREETKKDINLKIALEYTVTGWPTYKQDDTLAARDIFVIRSEHGVCNGLLVKGDRIVITYTMRIWEGFTMDTWESPSVENMQTSQCGGHMSARTFRAELPPVVSTPLWRKGRRKQENQCCLHCCLIVHFRKWAWTCASSEDCSTWSL